MAFPAMPRRLDSDRCRAQSLPSLPRKVSDCYRFNRNVVLSRYCHLYVQASFSHFEKFESMKVQTETPLLITL